MGKTDKMTDKQSDRQTQVLIISLMSQGGREMIGDVDVQDCGKVLILVVQHHVKDRYLCKRS